LFGDVIILATGAPGVRNAPPHPRRHGAGEGEEPVTFRRGGVTEAEASMNEERPYATSVRATNNAHCRSRERLTTFVTAEFYRRLGGQVGTEVER